MFNLTAQKRRATHNARHQGYDTLIPQQSERTPERRHTSSNEV